MFEKNKEAWKEMLWFWGPVGMNLKHEQQHGKPSYLAVALILLSFTSPLNVILIYFIKTLNSGPFGSLGAASLVNKNPAYKKIQPFLLFSPHRLYISVIFVHAHNF